MNDRVLVAGLLRSREPSLRWKVRTQVLDEGPDSPAVLELREQIRHSPRVRALLRHMLPLGRSETSRRVYYKWQGLQWTFQTLVDLGYPEGDESLRPAIEGMVDLWLRAGYYREHGPEGPATGVLLLRGRYRRCASQQGNALRSLVALGLDDGRAERLAERLMYWQWPDGGWNCDVDPNADTSSFLETLLPMQGLALYGARRRKREATAAARRAAEVFLSRRLYRRRSDGRVIRREFVELHYPRYYYYDVLGGLRGMAEVGRLNDPRCTEALDYLESRQLPGGGWPAEAPWGMYRPRQFVSRGEWVAWGPRGTRRRNDWVTAEVLALRHAAGRLAM